MKRILSIILAILIFSSNLVFAQEEEVMEYVQGPFFPETYVKRPVRLMATNNSLENILLNAWNNITSEISNLDSFRITPYEFKKLYFRLKSENPLMYHIGTSYHYGETDNYVSRVIIDYTETNKTKVKEMQDAIKAAGEEILLLINDDMTDFEKVMTVHNYMILHYEYDYTYSNYDASIMVTKTGVCQAYSYAFKYMMDLLEVPCVFVPAESMYHGWNMVNIDGSWYHIDLTWDDASDDQYGMVQNRFALLSDAQIQALNHYGYDTNGLTADSDYYDNAPWHNSTGEVVSSHGTSYWVAGNKLVSSKGEVIFENLDEKSDGWNIGDGYVLPNTIYAGVAEHNGTIYFNSDEAIYSFNPKKDKKPIKILEKSAVCGLFVDMNNLNYNSFDYYEEVYDEATGNFLGYRFYFKKDGEKKLSTIRFGSPRYENGSIIVRVYKEDSNPITVYSYGETVDMCNVLNKGLAKIRFNAEDEQTIFFWNNRMQPLTEKQIHKLK